MPAGRERTRFGLSIADDAGDEEIRVVEGGSLCVRERVAELATLVDRARSFRVPAWLGMPPGNENCRKSSPQPLLILRSHAGRARNTSPRGKRSPTTAGPPCPRTGDVDRRSARERGSARFRWT